jgi:DNA-binding transcriptional LysR family regulator
VEVHYTLRQLQYFVAVAQTGTLSAGAARCHVSPPALSLAVSQLEHSLGVQLFVRQRAKGAELTAAGGRVLDHALDLLAQAERLLQRAEVETGSELVGDLTVGCYTTLAPLLIPPLLTGFRDLCPGVSLAFSEYAQPEVQRELRDGVVDMALLYEHQLDPDFEYVVVQVLRPYVLLPAAHRFADQDTVSLAALAEEPMILFDVPPSRENWLRITRGLAIEPLVGHRTHNFELARCLVGRGVGYAPLFQRPPLDLTYERLPVVPKAISEPIPPLRIVLAYPSVRNLSARARRFADFAVSRHTSGETVVAGTVADTAASSGGNLPAMLIPNKN